VNNRLARMRTVLVAHPEWATQFTLAHGMSVLAFTITLTILWGAKGLAIAALCWLWFGVVTAKDVWVYWQAKCRAAEPNELVNIQNNRNFADWLVETGASERVVQLANQHTDLAAADPEERYILAKHHELYLLRELNSWQVIQTFAAAVALVAVTFILLWRLAFTARRRKR